MKTTDIQGKVERTGDPAEFGGIVDLHFSKIASLLNFLTGEFDGARCEINALHLPPGSCESNDIRAGAAADIDGSTRFVGFDEFEEFGGADACIPGRLVEIPIMKLQTSE